MLFHLSYRTKSSLPLQGAILPHYVVQRSITRASGEGWIRTNSALSGYTFTECCFTVFVCFVCGGWKTIQVYKAVSFCYFPIFLFVLRPPVIFPTFFVVHPHVPVGVWQVRRTSLRSNSYNKSLKLFHAIVATLPVVPGLLRCLRMSHHFVFSMKRRIASHEDVDMIFHIRSFK